MAVVVRSMVVVLGESGCVRVWHCWVVLVRLLAVSVVLTVPGVLLVVAVGHCSAAVVLPAYGRMDPFRCVREATVAAPFSLPAP